MIEPLEMIAEVEDRLKARLRDVELARTPDARKRAEFDAESIRMELEHTVESVGAMFAELFVHAMKTDAIRIFIERKLDTIVGTGAIALALHQLRETTDSLAVENAYLRSELESLARSFAEHKLGHGADGAERP